MMLEHPRASAFYIVPGEWRFLFSLGISFLHLDLGGFIFYFGANLSIIIIVISQRAIS